MPAPAAEPADRIREVNVRYHDLAAASYDTKWGIDFGPIGHDQVRRKIVKALGGWPGQPFSDALEVGAGTGYFTLNMLQLGLIERATATDISPRMLEVLAASAGELDLDVTTVRAEAERLPFADASFDLVFGHAVLHHVPDLGAGLAELRRVLRPGGTLAFCGEPSRYGELVATVPKRIGWAAAPVWRAALGASRREGDAGEVEPEVEVHELEREVDVHAFAPGRLRRELESAGFERIRIRGEELLANIYGWTVRTMETTAVPEEVPMGWRSFAFRGYLGLQRLDAALLEPRLPAGLFYNLVISARSPDR